MYLFNPHNNTRRPLSQFHNGRYSGYRIDWMILFKEFT